MVQIGVQSCKADSNQAVQWWNVPKKFPLILMKLWDLIEIGLSKMCTKFRQKNYQKVPLLGENCVENLY